MLVLAFLFLLEFCSPHDESSAHPIPRCCQAGPEKQSQQQEGNAGTQIHVVPKNTSTLPVFTSPHRFCHRSHTSVLNLLPRATTTKRPQRKKKHTRRLKGRHKLATMNHPTFWRNRWFRQQQPRYQQRLHRHRQLQRRVGKSKTRKTKRTKKMTRS